MVVFLIVAELVAIACFVIAIINAPIPINSDWLRFGILAAGATVHIQLTHRQDESRRNRVAAVHIDLTGVWIFPAAVVLPVPLTLLLVLLMRIQRWFTARRPAHKFVFSSITHALAAVLAHTVYEALTPAPISDLSGWAALREFAVLVLTGAVYEAVQLGLIGGILALGATSAPTLRNVLGSKDDNILETVTVGLGIVTAVLLVVLPPSVAIMTLVTVLGNRLAELGMLQEDVRTDPKTGVFNMRGWTESAERALARASRAGTPLGLLMVDLDYFKWINDSYGHPAGDDVLRSVAQALGEATRPSDVVGRFGGEEFLVLLPDAGEQDSLAAAERIRARIADLRIPTTNKRGGRATVAGRTTSVGVAVYPRHADALDTLMQAADAAVYEAKERGRNQVQLAPVD